MALKLLVVLIGQLSGIKISVLLMLSVLFTLHITEANPHTMNKLIRVNVIGNEIGGNSEMMINEGSSGNIGQSEIEIFQNVSKILGNNIINVNGYVGSGIESDPTFQITATPSEDTTFQVTATPPKDTTLQITATPSKDTTFQMTETPSKDTTLQITATPSKEIDFSTYGGSAHGSSHNGQQPAAAFLKTGGFWHSGPQDVVPPFTARNVPQAIWWKFEAAVRVVKFSFASRPDSMAVSDGATNYVFWGTNHDECSEQTNWVTLHEDNPGTPFTSDNTPKEVELDNETAYTCYGLKITAVGGRSGGDTPVTMSNVRYYIME